MKKPILLFIIVALGFVLRLWQVASIPVILNRDEAALAYNAFLLKQTGKDEWGQRWPVALESFGDYKLVGYPLLLIGSFSLFGYNDAAVKLPSIIAGTLLIFLAYILVRKILKLDENVALFAAFLLAVQPVFFFYSRIAFEANVALCFFVGGLILLLKNKSLIFDALALVLFFCAVFIYNTPLLLLPFLLPMVVYLRGWRQWKKWLPPLMGMILVMALGFSTLLSVSKQKSGITIFSDELMWQRSAEYHQHFSGIAQKILGNRAVFYSGILIGNYFKTFTPDFLIFHGGPHPWHQLPGFGHVYATVYILALVGLIIMLRRAFLAVKRRDHSLRIEKVLLYLLFVSPLPSAVTVDAPHATRSLLFLFLFVIFAVLGANVLLGIKRLPKKVFFAVVVLLISIEAGRYFYTYFTAYKDESVAILKGGFDTTILDVDKKRPLKRGAIIDDGGYQYILAAWYLKLAPADFFATINHHLADKIGFRYGYIVSRYRFIKAPTDKDGQEKILVWWDEAHNKWQVEE